MRLVSGFLMTATLLVLASSMSVAQTDYSNRTATASLTAGLATNFGASMIIDPPLGSKVSPIFAFSVSAASTYPLTPVISACLNLGYESRGTKLRAENDADFYTITRVGYFTINPGFQFSAFYLGMNFMMPMGGTNTIKAGPTFSETTSDMTSAEEDKLETLIEPRLGAVIPLMEDKNGFLGLTVMGGYTLNEISDRGSNLTDDDGTFNMVAGYLGVTYQFAIPGTSRN